MNYIKLGDGYVTRRQPGTATSVVSCPRSALLANGDIVCTFIAQSAPGINDFRPMICRSADGGITWSEARPIWPEMASSYSIFGSISATPAGHLYFYGTRTKIEIAGEPFWSDATQGLKQNELIWARSRDGGMTWSKMDVIPMPVPGSAEAPGAMFADDEGRLTCCYSPYNTLDAGLLVETNQVVCMYSRDFGTTWKHSTMLRFPNTAAKGAEAWVVRLRDGRLLGTAWHILKGEVKPNAYALSSDAGASWTETNSTEIWGQSTALTPLADGRALFLYNQRTAEKPGVWMAVVQPTKDRFGIAENHPVWLAPKASHHAGKTNAEDWTDFAFGEPAALALPDQTILVTLWVMPQLGGGIVYLKLKLV